MRRGTTAVPDARGADGDAPDSTVLPTPHLTDGPLPAVEALESGDAGSASRGPALLERAWFAGGWIAVVVLGWLTVSRALRITRPAQFTVLLQSLTPLAFLPAYVLLATALWRRRWAHVVAAGVLVLVHVALVWPVIGAGSVPAWAASAPHVTVLSANVYDANPTPRAAASMLVASDVDVLILAEVSPAFLEALDAAGIDARFPYHQRGEFAQTTTNIEAIYSRLPMRGASMMPVSEQAFPTAVVEVGPATVRLLAVHINDPIRDSAEWQRELSRVDDIAGDSSGPLVIAGDFNSTRWNPQYADLLDGLRDSVDSRGRGLSSSWPVSHILPFPVLRLDHALGNGSVAAVDGRDITVPGSDHRGLITTWAIHDLGQ